VVANVHCGWRGQVQNILGDTVRLLQSRFGTRPADLYAAVGPSLGPCCAEFRNFRREFPPALWTYQVRPTYFDLWRLSRDQLAEAGLLPARLDLAGLCTRCGADEFYSYRRDKVTGRQGAIIALKLKPAKASTGLAAFPDPRLTPGIDTFAPRTAGAGRHIPPEGRPGFAFTRTSWKSYLSNHLKTLLLDWTA